MARELTPPVKNRRFEDFRREVISKRQPVSAEVRAAWYEEFQASVQEVFGSRKSQFRKPGQPAEMFKSRVFLEPEDTERWEDIFAPLEDHWRERFAKPGNDLHTYAGFDNHRMVFEFALLDGENYLTGSITVDRWVDPNPQ